MYKVLFTGNTLSSQDMEDLKSQNIEIVTGKTDYSEEELIKQLAEAHGYILGGDEIATKRAIESAQNLKIISFYGVGYERFVDVAAATSKGILVTNTPHANAYTVAEFTIGLILDCVKHITQMNNDTKKGGWNKIQFWNVWGRNVGIVGMGTIGKYVARILHNGFGANILYTSRTAKHDVEKELSARRVELSELLKESDIVSLHTAYADDTIGLIGQSELDLMKSTAVLVNTARAELVDGHALFQTLRDGRIAIAAFDGYYVEPVPTPENDPYKLLTLEDSRFIITPHTAFNSQDAIKAMEKMAVNSVVEVLSGRIPEHVVNRTTSSTF